MKNFSRIITVILMLTGIGYLVMRQINTRRRLKRVADDGYETAQDVLYPHCEIKSRKVHYGPIHPGLK